MNDPDLIEFTIISETMLGATKKPVQFKALVDISDIVNSYNSAPYFENVNKNNFEMNAII